MKSVLQMKKLEMEDESTVFVLFTLYALFKCCISGNSGILTSSVGALWHAACLSNATDCKPLQSLDTTHHWGKKCFEDAATLCPSLWH